MKESHRAAGKRRRFLNSCLGEVLVILLLVLVVVTPVSLLVPPGSPGQALDQPGCEINRRFPARVMKWCRLITTYAREQDLPPDLVAALIWYESGGNPSVVSADGAVGLMQVMPRDGLAATFECQGRPCFDDRPHSSELKDPEFNIAYGTGLLKELSDAFEGDIRQALKAYGPTGIDYTYADTILSIYQQHSD